jgi:hypothetical protein
MQRLGIPPLHQGPMPERMAPLLSGLSTQTKSPPQNAAGLQSVKGAGAYDYLEVSQSPGISRAVILISSLLTQPFFPAA